MTRRFLVIGPDTPSGREVELTEPFTQIGRSEEAAIRLSSPGISALHASLLVKPDKTLIVDLDSTNGTFVNGKKVKNAELRNGDEIRLADTRLRYREERTGASMEPGHTATLFSPVTGEKASRLEALYAVLDSALLAKDRSDLIKVLLYEIRRLLDLDLCGLFLADTALFHVLEGEELKSESRTESISASVLEKVLSTGSAVFLEHIGNDSAVLGFHSLLNFKIQSLLCVPVRGAGGAPLGALYCVSRRKAELDMIHGDRLLLKAFSSIISLSLENLSRREKDREQARDLERKKQESRFIPVLSRLRLEKENLAFKQGAAEQELFGLDRPEYRPLTDFVDRASKADLPVLLAGPTGTGKTAAAHAIHRKSRLGRPFTVIDCTTIPSELLESELFGHEKGAFTGAHAKRQGKVALSEGGTLFLDEIGELPLNLQAKLLRLIETGEYEPVGSLKKEKLCARLVFATNRDLKAEVKAGRFREDLYFRLNVLQFRLSSLCENPGLILPLAGHFLEIHGRKTRAVKAFSEKAKEALLAHAWPGNIRELENAVLRGLFHGTGGTIEAEDLALSDYSIQGARAAFPEGADAPETGGLDLKEAREKLDVSYIRRALALTERNVSKAARVLHISRNSLIDLIRKYKIQ